LVPAIRSICSAAPKSKKMLSLTSGRCQHATPIFFFRNRHLGRHQNTTLPNALKTKPDALYTSARITVLFLATLITSEIRPDLQPGNRAVEQIVRTNTPCHVSGVATRENNSPSLTVMRNGGSAGGTELDRPVNLGTMAWWPTRPSSNVVPVGDRSTFRRIRIAP